ncbi:unnamed protein product [Owenia fusiformis]|uniref:UBX domain-containing protein n=1 Tax=Owenia fusiformis TaxID=6347 RepID=A0A8S4PIY2_OWEFU|nr:unnamed protein product [Owenia fusiformis]
MTFRYSGLPNLAKLELVKATKSRTETKVTLAVQLETGERLQNEFNPSCTLMEVLTSDGVSVVSESGSRHPVCIYMREEIIGVYALENTTLRGLGLIGGRAILRLIHREVDDATIAEINAKIDKENARQQKMNSNTVSRDTVQAVTKTLIVSPSECESVKSQNETEPMDTGNEQPHAKHETPHVNVEAMDTTDQPHSAQTQKCDVTNPEENNGDMDSQSSEATSKQETTGNESSSGPGRITGVQIFPPGEVDVTQELTPNQRQAVQQLSGMFQAQLSQNQSGARPRQIQQPVVSEFKFPESTKGKSLYKNELSDVSRKEFKPCDREIMVYNIEHKTAQQSNITDEDLSDDFFQVTESDLRKMMMDLSKEAHSQDDAPLMTAAMRQAQNEQKMSQYNRAVIRIQFPDRVVLQGLFRPRETVFAVEKFVKENLADPSLDFYLYTSPPKCELKDNSMNMFDAKLLPASVVYFGCKEKQEHYLASTLLQCEPSSQQAADLVAIQGMKREHEAVGSSSDEAMATQSKRPANNAAKSTSKPAGKGVPKWFKTGK